MPPQSKAKTHPRKAPRRTSYHHGRLRQALIEEALLMVKESGAESVSVRDVARRAGVSPGAPFRHFATRTALMTAVAEQAMGRFRDEIVRALAEARGDDPLNRFRALGTAYMRWVIGNPQHFEVISNRAIIDFDRSESLRRDNDEIRSLMEELLGGAHRRGLLRSGDAKAISFAARALAYGVARMFIDGHLPQWGVVETEAADAFNSVFDLFLNGVTHIRQSSD